MARPGLAIFSPQFPFHIVASVVTSFDVLPARSSRSLATSLRFPRDLFKVSPPLRASQRASRLERRALTLTSLLAAGPTPVMPSWAALTLDDPGAQLLADLQQAGSEAPQPSPPRPRPPPPVVRRPGYLITGPRYFVPVPGITWVRLSSSRPRDEKRVTDDGRTGTT